MRSRRVHLFAAFVVAAASAVAAATAFGSAGFTKAAQTSVLTPRMALVSKGSFAKASPRRQASELGLPRRGAGSLLRDGGYVAEVRVSGGVEAAARRFRGIRGVRILGHSVRYHNVTLSMRSSAIRRVAHQRSVQAVVEQLTPEVSRVRGLRGLSSPHKVPVCHGSVTSEGDAQLNAARVKSQFGDFGAVPVGILSDSFDRNTAAVTHAAGDVARGDLPGPGNPCGRTTKVLVGDDSVSGEDEGRAMLQVVHDLAPQAALGFATASSGETNFANNIVNLANSGAKVIADDVTYFDEPFFQDGIVTDAVNAVTARGIPYFSSAANNNLIDSSGRNIASWETPNYRDGGACGAPLGGAHCLDFNPGAGVDNRFGVTIDPGATLKVDLQWAEPWFGVTDDLDLYILNAAGTSLIASSTNNNPATTKVPFEFASFKNNGTTPANVSIAVNRVSGTGLPRTKLALLQNGGGVSETEYPSSSGGDTVGPTIFGHNGTGSAMSVAAVPFNNSSQIESYSSRGPVAHYFGPVNGTTPASPISPTVLNKPDIAATDCAQTTFFAQFTGGVWRFCGTSEAAPHAAAVAALELNQNPGTSVGQIYGAMTSTARAVGAFAHDAAGAGLINAAAAVQSIDAGPPAKAKIKKHPKKRTRKTKAKFKLAARGASSFVCKLDHKQSKICGSKVKVNVKRGRKHTFQVAGVDNVGKVGPLSKKFKWRVLG